VYVCVRACVPNPIKFNAVSDLAHICNGRAEGLIGFNELTSFLLKYSVLRKHTHTHTHKHRALSSLCLWCSCRIYCR